MGAVIIVPVLIAFATVFGLLAGSFFNVLIWRLPRNESIVFPGSHCPHCNRPIRPWENIPVLSFLFLRGKCAGCKGVIPVRYPAVEIATALMAVLLTVHILMPAMSSQPAWWQLIAPFMQVLALLILIPIAVIDIEHMIIPDALSLSGLVMGILVSFVPGPLTPLQAGLGLLAGGGPLFLLGLFGEHVLKKQEAMGGGDIKLMAFLGAVWGWKVALLGIAFGSLVGAIGAGALMLTGKLNEEHRIPFGPYLAIGSIIAALWGNELVAAYLNWVDKLLA